MRVADAVVAQLEALGVLDVFSVTGGASAWLNDAFSQSEKITNWFLHHEQAVVMAAEGYARRTGKIGVALITVGPGATNAVTGVAAAWMDSIPLLIISGQSFSQQTIGSSGMRQVGIQEANIVEIVASITKTAVTLDATMSPDSKIAELVSMAHEGRPGPVWLEIPADIQKQEIEPSTPTRNRPTKPPSSGPVNFSPIVEALLSANRPLVHVGHGVRLSESHPDLLDFLETHRVPFVTSHNAIDIAPTAHHLNLGFPGIFGNRSANFALECCDFYLALGTRLTLAQTGYSPEKFAPGAKGFVVDVDKAELGKPWLATRKWQTFHADVADAISSLRDNVPKDYLAPRRWNSKTDRLKADFPHLIPEVREFEQVGTVNSYLLQEALSDHCSFVDTFVTDMGLSYQCTMQSLVVLEGQRLFTNTGLAPMGWGLPGAIGACIGSGFRHVVCETGDGGLMMNLQELATISHHKLPIIILIFNNGGYLTIKQSQEIGFESRIVGVNSETGLGFPNFVSLAESFDIPSVAVECLSEIPVAIEAAQRAGGPFLIDVAMSIDQIQAPKAINFRDEDGNLRQTELVNLWPQLTDDKVAYALMVD